MGTVTIIQGPTGVDISISGTTFPITDSTRTEGFSSKTSRMYYGFYDIF